MLLSLVAHYIGQNDLLTRVRKYEKQCTVTLQKSDERQKPFENQTKIFQKSSVTVEYSVVTSSEMRNHTL